MLAKSWPNLLSPAENGSPETEGLKLQWVVEETGGTTTQGPVILDIAGVGLLKEASLSRFIKPMCHIVQQFNNKSMVMKYFFY